MYDLIIVGSGPAGLSAALAAQRLNLEYLVIERGVVANTIHGYPTRRPLFSTPEEVELERGALRVGAKPTREELLAHYTETASRHGVNVHTSEEAERIVRLPGGFIVQTTRDNYRARAVLVAVGGFGRQRKLNVAGEDRSRVSYRFSEADTFAGKSVLVVGGGNSAAEASLFLAEAQARVTLSLRRPSLDRPEDVPPGEHAGPPAAKIKPWVREPLERAAAAGRIQIITSSEVVEIRPRTAILRVARRAAVDSAEVDLVEIECDHIFALLGADPDTRLLEEAGAEIGSDGRPIYDNETFETTVSGLYVAGHLTREMHMKNAILIPPRVVEGIASQLLSLSVDQKI